MAEFFKFKRDAWRFLREEIPGFTVTERTFYNHVRSGKVLPNDQGWYSRTSLLAYAEGFKLKSESDDLARLKIRREIELLESEIELIKSINACVEGARIDGK